MAKEVVLMADVKGVGSEGDVVKVADGYARNFLLPKKLAAPLTAASTRRLEKIRREREERLSNAKEGAVALMKKIEAASCTITVKTGEEGKLFGSVTSSDVVKALSEQGIDVSKQQIDMADAIKELGVFNVTIKLHPEVKGTIKVWVVEE